MRITTAHSYATAVDNLQQRQQELQRAQTQLTSGKRVARASDDPTAAARVERALATHSRAVANQRGMEASRNAMQQAEGALGNATEAMQQVRELLVAAGNATYSDAERANFGARIAGLREQLLAIANRGDGAGGYLFGGQGTSEPPFADAPGGVRFSGAGGSLVSAGAQPLPLSADGARIWLQVPDPDTGIDNLSAFDLLDRVANELQTAGRSNEAISETVRQGVRGLDATMDHMGSARSALGETLNRADAVEVRLSEQALMAASDRSAAEDLDMVQALSEFQNQQTGYDAALKAYSMVQRLSLFDYVSG